MKSSDMWFPTAIVSGPECPWVAGGTWLLIDHTESIRRTERWAGGEGFEWGGYITTPANSSATAAPMATIIIIIIIISLPHPPPFAELFKNLQVALAYISFNLL